MQYLIFLLLTVSGDVEELHIVKQERVEELHNEKGLISDLWAKRLESFANKKIEYYPGVYVDNSQATFSIKVEPVEDEKYLNLYPDYYSAISDFKEANIIPSVNLIDGVEKQFNDGFYAGVEIVLQKGIEGVFMGKKEMLERLLDKLCRYRDSADGFKREITERAIVYVSAGLSFVEEPRVPEDLRGLVEKSIRSFKKDALRSKPIGFFTWTPELEEIFSQDRYFQGVLPCDTLYLIDFGAAILMSKFIFEDEELFSQHKLMIELYKGITNPLDALTVEDVYEELKGVGDLEWYLESKEGVGELIELVKRGKKCKEIVAKVGLTRKQIGFALIPYSRSKEADLFERGICPIGSIEDFIAAIRKGELSLKPTEESGWYEYQQYALEGLIMPDKIKEAKKIEFGEKYKKHLEETFRTTLTKARETHVKQLRIPVYEKSAVVSEFFVSPILFLEPLPTVYLREARGYKFLLTILAEGFGDSLGSLLVYEEGGPTEKRVLDELKRLTLLMYGFSIIAAENIGDDSYFDKDELSKEEIEEARSLAREWLMNYTEESALKKDTRVFLPVFSYRAEPSWWDRYWGTAGVRLIKIKIEYIKKPVVEGLLEEQAIKYKPVFYLLPVDKFLSFIRDWKLPPPNRKEYHKIFDASKTFKEALRRLRIE